ncbi:alpha/beta hydrolase [Agrobacterium rubi]|uniref:alpha/beta hydrolase n=1 Tax=Agrobacterium rubi TaxID=28099 RepID=UPI0015716D49|nr:alpha/beta hydrolase [Agrobacterium rubi]NTF08272.1 alpha/beta hydrolase [Agrobacterium rubi]NTF20500.1 alpha/beta hydrolase [Agrobacterium rubi]NTF27471.1 alpha/beta hydrolase [Agrobacterium rubi]
MTKDSYVHKVRAGAPGQPAFFVFHGTGGDENQFFDFGSRLLPNATVVSPQGDVSEHGAARFFRRTAEGVYDMADLDRATRQMAAFVTANRDYHEAGLVVGFGFSNGANILANVLVEYPDLFDAAVLMHPLIPFEPKPAPGLAPRRVLMTAGERDPICPIPLTNRLANYFRAQGCEVEMEWHAGGHDIRGNEIEAVKTFLAPYV